MKKAYIYVLISTFLFSSMEISLKLAGSQFNGVQLNFLRFLIGGLALVPLAVHNMKQRHVTFQKQDIGTFLLTGFVGVVVSMTFFQIAVEVDAASTVAVLFSSNPIFALIFGYIILHETLTRSNLIAVVVSVIGLLVIVNPAHLTNPLGISLALIAALTFGLFAIMQRQVGMKRGYDGLTMNTFSFIAGALELMVIMILSHIQGVANLFIKNPVMHDFSNIPFFQGITIHNIILLAYIFLGVTAAGYVLYSLAMEASDVSTASLVFFIKPALAPILALIILHESIKLNTIIGVVIIVIGSTIMFIGNRYSSKADTVPYQQETETQKKA
ncbi:MULTISPECIES: DMT family transporter [Leuconostoc]|uniref:DMT family transporter n=1 Tax=Leuconostoc pseudomesenteroides TaxID=33968 RepID=A0A5B8T4T8_LEUPS|nr:MULTISPECIES: DMT family transporter [Leuconostoc]MBK0039859.1 EamA family transporter [Leuconostoc sp. S51]MBK0050818.1 EamA family transporter [Leuconostoc sp. S50]MBS0957022.1 EamA family transporter [Leuconostoc pseudomesenteroides]MCC7668188.1 EamA family transporter [Leuconostoc pseudomesenteroides]MCC8439065.1 EamA family transporter [Leuconostoc pseudomesenteroides]